MNITIKNLYRKKTPLELASEELADAERLLLEAQSGVEYAKAMVSYNADRVKRLRAYIATQGENTQ